MLRRDSVRFAVWDARHQAGQVQLVPQNSPQHARQNRERGRVGGAQGIVNRGEHCGRLYRARLSTHAHSSASALHAAAKNLPRRVAESNHYDVPRFPYLRLSLNGA
jgi:hypothetical protein